MFLNVFQCFSNLFLQGSIFKFLITWCSDHRVRNNIRKHLLTIRKEKYFWNYHIVHEQVTRACLVSWLVWISIHEKYTNSIDRPSIHFSKLHRNRRKSENISLRRSYLCNSFRGFANRRELQRCNSLLFDVFWRHSNEYNYFNVHVYSVICIRDKSESHCRIREFLNQFHIF